MLLRIGWSGVLLLSWVTLLGTSNIAAAEKAEAGRELFSYEWRQNDPRSAKGDGLGPMFNDVSCVACHKQGGVGGGGPVEKNVQVGSVFARGLFTAEGAAEQQRADLEKIHPGFLKTRSVVLHRSSTDDAYRDFRTKNFTPKAEVSTSAIFGLLWGSKVNPLAGVSAATTVTGQVLDEAQSDLPKLTKEQMNEVAQLKKLASSRLARRDFREISLLISERNTPALFGSGLIDSIPERVLRANAEMKHDAYPEVSGRVARSASGKVGRFGWKGQQSKLHDFVLAACATEVGLEVQGKSQGTLPYKSDYQAPGVDLTDGECRELTSFVATLPRPRQLATKDAESFTRISEGSNLFGAIGCAVCHTRDLGEVSGVFSDLLLHDMGPALSDPGEPGAYGGSDDDTLKLPLPPLAGDFGLSNVVVEVRGGGGSAGPGEWRTPPLWGVRDSAPYLHDGRAETLEQAIALHDGEAKRSMRRFFQLGADQRTEVMAFLDSLAAPE
jgi:CxxC motif-containing protein (DUF1111 family)